MMRLLSRLELNSRQMNYLKYSSMYNILSSMNHAISTNAMLKVVSSATSITNETLPIISYLTKDIFGQIGGVLYSLKTTKYMFDTQKERKKYAQIGAGYSQLGCLIENLSIIVPYQITCLSLASFFKNISFITIGSANTSKMAEISDKNIGNFYSKLTAVNTISSTIGLGLGIGIIHIIPSYSVRTYFIMPIISIGTVLTIRKLHET